jgi:D-alanine--poly(phosphoribitol) ligase subunit 2
MSDQSTYNEIAKFFSERLNFNVASRDADLFDSGILDSLSFVDLMMHLEQQFDIRISVDELEPENFRSIEKIASFVAARNGVKKTAVA